MQISRTGLSFGTLNATSGIKKEFKKDWNELTKLSEDMEMTLVPALEDKDSIEIIVTHEPLDRQNRMFCGMKRHSVSDTFPRESSKILEGARNLREKFIGLIEKDRAEGLKK